MIFKAGDKVKIIDRHTCFDIEHVYTVTKMDATYCYFGGQAKPDGGPFGENHGFYHRRFKLYEETGLRKFVHLQEVLSNV